MKSCTNLGQSQKLKEILPIDSSDWHYARMTHDFKGNPVDSKWSHPRYGNPNSKNAYCMVRGFMEFETTPCWSLSALLNELGKIKEYWFYHLIFDPTLNKYSVEVEADSWRYEGDLYDNATDAVYEAILKLYEQKSK